MSPAGKSLDLNNLPEEYGKQPLEESSSITAASADTRAKKKKNGGKDDTAKVYECRFCSLKFCKSQALGGHMNRHRQERETETLNRARQLVFNNEGMAGAAVHMGLRDLNFGGSQSVSPGGFQQRASSSISDPCLQFRPVYPRLPTQPPHLQPYIYPSTSSHTNAYPPSYPPSHPPIGEYFIGHVLTEGSPRQPHHSNFGSSSSNNITCFGAPLTNSFQVEGVRSAPVVRDGSAGNQTPEARNWNCSYGHG